MKTNFILHSVAMLFFVIAVSAQQGINYKAIIHDEHGDPLANTLITVQFTILENGTTNVYREIHDPITDDNGIIIVIIGEGTVISGDFTTINWGSTSHFLKTDIDTGDGLTDIGITEFKAVPYAIHAETVTNVNDEDADPSNELQDLTLNEDELGLTKSTLKIDLSGYKDNTDNQALSLAGNTLGLTGTASTVDLSTYVSPWTIFTPENLYTNGKVGIGTTPLLDQLRIAGNLTDLGIENYASFENRSSRIHFRKSASDTKGTMVTTENGHRLGEISFLGVNNSGTWGTGAAIDVIQDGDAGAQRVPGTLRLYTYTNNNQSNFLVLSTNGNVGIGTTEPATKLEVSGTVKATEFVSDGTITSQGNIASLTGSITAATQISAGGDIVSHSNITAAGNLFAGDINFSGELLHNGSHMNIDDADADPNNEIQGLTSVLTQSNDGGANQIKNIADPTEDQDVATKKYLDDLVSGGGATTYSVGDFAQGGIIFWLDETGQHGLIVSTENINPPGYGVEWGSSDFTTNAVRDGLGGGISNNVLIIAIQGTPLSNDYAALVCAKYQGGGYADWYLPSKHELNLLYMQKGTIGGLNNYYYWSSTEGGITDLGHLGAWEQDFTNGTQDVGEKNWVCYIRAVRAF